MTEPDAIPELAKRAYAERVRQVDEAALLRFFERSVPWYKTFLAPWLPGRKDARVLDVPCGYGNLLFALRAAGYTNVRGVDIDPGQVSFAKKLGLAAELGDAFRAVEAEADGSVSRVFSLDFVEHVAREDAVRFCELARRKLSAGGFLLLRTPSADGPFGAHDRYNDMTHRWGMTSNAGLQLLTLAGFPESACSVVQEAPVPYKLVNRVRRHAFLATSKVLGAWLEFCGIGAPRVWTRSMWLVARASDR